MARGFPQLGQGDFTTRQFSKSEYQWFRNVTVHLTQLDLLLNVADVTFTSITFSTVATADAAAQGAAYVQADAQSIAALANSLKAAFNAQAAQLTSQNTEIAALKTALNQVLTALRTQPVST